jgi:hypothetical protein
MPTIETRASKIIAEFSQAQTQLAGKTVVLSNGIAGTVPKVRLDELHGLRMSIEGHDGNWPVSTIKFLEEA